MHFQNPKDGILFEISLKLIRAIYKSLDFSRQLLPLSGPFRSRQSCNQKSILRRKTLLKNDSIDISFYIFKGLTIVLCLEMFRSYNLLSNKCCLRCSTCEGQLSRSLRFFQTIRIFLNLRRHALLRNIISRPSLARSFLQLTNFHGPQRRYYKASNFILRNRSIF